MDYRSVIAGRIMELMPRIEGFRSDMMKRYLAFHFERVGYTLPKGWTAKDFSPHELAMFTDKELIDLFEYVILSYYLQGY